MHWESNDDLKIKGKESEKNSTPLTPNGPTHVEWDFYSSYWTSNTNTFTNESTTSQKKRKDISYLTLTHSEVKMTKGRFFPLCFCFFVYIFFMFNISFSLMFFFLFVLIITFFVMSEHFLKHVSTFSDNVNIFPTP